MFVSPPVSARFLSRANRFVVVVELQGITTTASLPNPGRLGEILLPGVELLLEPGTRSRVDFLLTPRSGGDPDARAVTDAMTLTAAKDTTTAKGVRYLEVKSCTLFNGPFAMFPDAITERGRRHVEERSCL